MAGPNPAEIEDGNHLFLRVEARGFPREAQWFRDGVALAGETNETLIRFGASKADAGVYQFRLSNPSGSVTTAPVRITVLERPSGINLISNPGFETLDRPADPQKHDPYPAISWKGESFPRLWNYPDRVPLNYDGREDVLQGTNYACVFAIATSDGFGLRLTQQASLEANLAAAVEPMASYELTRWFSRTDHSLTPDPGLEVRLWSGTGRQLSLGTMVCTNAQGWTRFRATLITAVHYDRIRLVGTRSIAGEEGFSGVFLDQLALRKVETVRPEFAPIQPILLPPWSALILTNTFKPRTDVDVREAPLHFAFDAEPPAGTTLNAASGVLQWWPRTRDAGTTQTLSVTVGSQFEVGTLATNRIAVQVQQGVELNLGAAWGNASLRPLMPLTATFYAQPDEHLTEIQADLQFPDAAFLEPRLESLDSLVEEGAIESLGALNYRLRFRLRAPGATRGTFPLGRLELGSGPTGVTTVETIRVTQISALSAGGSQPKATRALGGVVRIVNAAPLLEMEPRSGAPVLRIYGNSSTRYRIERRAHLGSVEGWIVVRELTAGSFPTEIPDFDVTSPTGFFRAVALP